MKSDDLVMFNGKECDSAKLSALFDFMLPTVCRVVEKKISECASAEQVNDAALIAVNAIMNAMSVKSLDSSST